MDDHWTSGHLVEFTLATGKKQYPFFEAAECILHAHCLTCTLKSEHYIYIKESRESNLIGYVVLELAHMHLHLCIGLMLLSKVTRSAFKAYVLAVYAFPRNKTRDCGY